MENHHVLKVNHLFLWAISHGHVKKPGWLSIQGLAVNAPWLSAPQRISRIKSHQRTGGLDQESGIKTWSEWTDSCASPKKFMGEWTNCQKWIEMAVFFSPSLLDVYDIESTTILRFTDLKSGIRNLSKVLVDFSNMRGEPGQTIEHKPNTNQTQTKHKPNTTSFGDFFRLNHQFYGEVIVML